MAKLPEEFAPTGPKLSKFPILPAPPIRPHLFADEARFVLLLSLLVGATEFAAWIWLAHSLAFREALVVAALRLLRPLWAKAGVRFSRVLVASSVMAVAIVCGSVFMWPFAALGIALPALGDLCATTLGDTITVERRAAAWSWLDMAQGLGGALGFALGNAPWFGWSWYLWLAALAIALVGIPQLRDRGTPRSSWPAAAYLHSLRTPLGLQLTALAFACGLLGRRTGLSTIAAMLLPLAAMSLVARLESRMPNAIWLPRLALALAASSWVWPPLGVFAIGMMFAAIPAATVRAVGEMERPLASSLAWSALFVGAAIGAAI